MPSDQKFAKLKFELDSRLLCLLHCVSGATAYQAWTVTRPKHGEYNSQNKTTRHSDEWTATTEVKRAC